MKHPIRFLVCALSILFLSGCATTSYTPPEGSDYGQIRAKGDRKGLFNWNRITFLNIDGVHVGVLLYDGQFYKIEKGERRIRVSYLGNRTLSGGSFLAAGPFDLHATIEKNVKYEVAGEYTDEKVVIFVREVESGKIVSEKIDADVRYETVPTTTTIPIFIPTR